ncbi:MAG TPA: sigma-54 dependent transcriptional regulator [Pyrinomonadaceae bacterium]|nr:sigma-54 dependent transcriptional regulator [Pyrinomonadaceae bacterium]
MRRILVADNSPRDAQRFCTLIEDAGLKAELCGSGEEVARQLDDGSRDWAAIVVSFEIPGPPFGLELLVHSRRVLPDVPFVVVSSSLDATLAMRAFALGARDFLEKPLDMQRVKSCVGSLLAEQDPYSPLVERLNATILGDSPALLSTLKQVAKVARHRGARVLLIGDSGTGKELLAQAIHDLGEEPDAPFVAVNVAALPKELIESALFGHEKGAFTGATDSHRGYMEEASQGTLFLDELGELDLSLQAKLLRAIQEKKFRRLKGTRDISFDARLICATNRDLALLAGQGAFRQDLFHRIAEVTIHVPPLRERKGDIDLLLEHFLSVYGGNRAVRFARETLTILHSYSFPGNIRQLENIVKSALIQCDGEVILPRHLPLTMMGGLLASEEQEPSAGAASGTADQPSNGAPDAAASAHQELFRELARSLPANWRDLPYKQMVEQYGRAFDRIYLPYLIERHRHNVTRATRAAGVDKKTFAQHWKDAGLPPLRTEEGESNE